MNYIIITITAIAILLAVVTYFHILLKSIEISLEKQVQNNLEQFKLTNENAIKDIDDLKYMTTRIIDMLIQNEKNILKFNEALNKSDFKKDLEKISILFEKLIDIQKKTEVTEEELIKKKNEIFSKIKEINQVLVENKNAIKRISKAFPKGDLKKDIKKISEISEQLMHLEKKNIFLINEFEK